MNNKIYKFLNGNILPEITVVPTRLTLSTYYPIIGENYRYTGHSSLRARSPEYTIDTPEGFKTIPANNAIIDKKSSDASYNFITNNCADATRCALEAITGKKMNPYFFTTPGDVLDFFKENFDDAIKVKSKNSGKEVYYTNITPKQLEIIKEQLLEQQLKNRKKRHKELLANARKWKHKKGGKAFVNGVNVLDSNPNAYKYVKKKYKMSEKKLLGGFLSYYNPNLDASSISWERWKFNLGIDDYLELKKNLLLKQRLTELEALLKKDGVILSILSNILNKGVSLLASKYGDKNGTPSNSTPKGMLNTDPKTFFGYESDIQ